MPGPVALVVLCGEADTLTLAVCACLGACVLGLLFLRACVLGGLPDMRMYDGPCERQCERKRPLVCRYQCSALHVWSCVQGRRPGAGVSNGPWPCVKQPSALCETAFGPAPCVGRPSALCATAFGPAPCVGRPSALCVTAFGRARPVCGRLWTPWCCVWALVCI